MVEKAYKIILEAFANKYDKAGEPYIFHLQRVAQPFLEDEYLHTIALLHDLFEDCPEWDTGRLQEIFPQRVVFGVEYLTKPKGMEYMEYIRTITNNDARKVKLSDLKDNMNLSRFRRKLTEKDLARVAKYHDAYLLLSHF